MTHTLSANELLARYAAGELTPTEAIGHQLERIAAIEPDINAVTQTLDTAAEEAAEATRLWATGTRPHDKPLLGVPVLIKEKHPVAGQPLDEAVPALRTVADEDHPIVKQLRNAGAIPIARTTNPEFCAATFTASREYGTTRNPWNLAASPGGSSGGSGAGLAAGYAPLATGSDIGGSTRIPAALCGVVGYKAPFGVVPGLHPSTMDWYRSDSAMGRTVGDVLTMHNVIAGQHRADPYSLPKREVEVAGSVDDLSGMRIGISPRLGDFAVSDAQVANLEHVARTLEKLGASVVEVNPEWTTEFIVTTAMAHYGHNLARAMQDSIARAGAEVSPYIEDFIAHTTAIAVDIPLHVSFARETQVRMGFASLFDATHALITPTVTRDFYPAEGPARSVDADGLFYWKDYLALPFNIGNRHPVLAVPSGVGAGGGVAAGGGVVVGGVGAGGSSVGAMPTGVQIAAKPYDEATVFRIGLAIERHRPWEYPFAGGEVG